MGSSVGRRNNAYLAAKKLLTGLPCHECGRPATIPDHDPPLHIFLNNVEQWAANGGRYLPHCKTCSSRQGARITNQRRKPRPSRRW